MINIENNILIKNSYVKFVRNVILMTAHVDNKHFHLVKNVTYFRNKYTDTFYLYWGNTQDPEKMGCQRLEYTNGRKVSYKTAIKMFIETTQQSKGVTFKK
jgi:hypothetical protein